ncbi:VOC family protein [Phenylobacterium sp.]|jgi:predicted enzyme related to lactoylglutathione lyase|uniref:VOC family protein n=1 Tax=Phenylobacterium sp. TaxID=1871053 RepID=UPI002F420003
MTDAATAPAAAALAGAPSVRFGFMKFVVRDLQGMADFYTRAFGLAVTQTIDLPDITELVLRRPGEEAGFSLILYWNKDGRPVEVGSGHGPLGLYLRDVDAAYAWAVSQGATPHRPPWDTEAMRVAFVLDPEGRELELISMRRP